MKLTAGSRHIELPLSKDAEERLFLEFSGLIYREFKIEASKEAVERFADELVNVDVITPIIENNTELRGITSTLVKRKPSLDNKRLIIGKCKCGKHYSIWLDERKSFYNFVCSGCEANIYIKNENLVESVYRCTECNKKYSFWSNGTLPFDLKCKNCRTELDMHYDKEKNMMINTY